MFLIATPDKPCTDLGFMAAVVTVEQPLTQQQQIDVARAIQSIADNTGATVAVLDPGIEIDFRL